ncbi:MAG: cytochrome c3 family protein [Nitrospirota bacterium]
MNPFRFFSKLTAWYSEKVPLKVKLLIVIFLLLFVVAMAFAGYKINDYFENDPNACMLCHVHDYAQQAWIKSKHNAVNCHECHHSSKKEQVEQMFKFAFLGQKAVPPRHGKVIVPWKLCITCHWEKKDKYPNAPLVNKSQFHAKHVFMEQIECSKCHGYVTHQFPTEERFCAKCHSGKEVHGTGMENLACLNCHTDRTKDLKPGRKKCLFCHGDKSIRDELIADGTIDVKRFQPSPDVIKKAKKIEVPDDAPMKIDCYQCHKPHTKVRPDHTDCLRCHPNELNVGRHSMHVKDLGMKCMDCHKPHRWKVAKEQAKKDCVKCHEYKDPDKFIGP